MLKNYFLTGWRHLIRTKAYSFINIIGLSIGMAIAILIGLWVYDELSFNKSFENYDRLGLVYHHITFGEETLTVPDIPAPFAEKLKTDFAEFEKVTITTYPSVHIIAHEQTIMSKSSLFIEPEFSSMFSLKMLQGKAFDGNDLHSVVLSRTLAETLIGNNPVGKMVKFDNRDQLVVTGVFEDFPANSQFAEVKILLPLRYFYSLNEDHQNKIDNWEDYSFQCFFLLKNNADLSGVEQKTRKVLYNNASGDGKTLNPEGILFPMHKWHLYDEFKNGVNKGGKIRFVWMFGVIGFFVLLLACINFMNLSTARSEKRSREVGVRKVLGSVRTQLVFQFLSESFVIVTISFIVGATIAAISLRWFNGLADKNIVMPWTNPVFILAIISFMLLTSLISGSYPALYLSSFSPVKVLKGTLNAGRFSAIPRKIMVVFQVTTSIVLIICTIIVYLQIQHARARPAGFDREGILFIPIRTDDLAKANYNSLRNALKDSGVVEDMATSDFPITGNMRGDASLTWEGKDPALTTLFALNSCSHDFPKTNGFQFVQGRDFSRDFSTDSSSVIINEMAAKLISDENVLGKRINFGHGKDRQIIGVIKDQVRWTPFVNQSPHLYYIDYANTHCLTVRLLPNVDVHDAIKKIETIIKTFDAGAPFEYKFVDDDYERLFTNEKRIGKLSSVFSALAIFISCIGIFGLASFAASRRTKEIGIRKVMGASVFGIWRMLTHDFLVLVIISIILGTPVAYYLAQQWLIQYDYRVEIPLLVFVLTALVSLIITLITVTFQALKAATMNPVKSIRLE